MQKALETATIAFDSDSGIGSITLNRPDALNALNGQLRADIETAFERLQALDVEETGVALHVVVIEGAGDRAFCAGADINEFADGSEADSSRPFAAIIEDCPAPVIAKIDGYCLGGGFELSLACDIRLASEGSRLGLPEVDLGLLPGAGGVQYVARLANPAFAQELAMTGNHISAAEAAEEDLVNHVYSSDGFEDQVASFVSEIANKPPLAVRGIKSSATIATELGLNEGRRFDQAQFSQLLSSEDHKEGVKAFAEDDYEPTFAGK